MKVGFGITGSFCTLEKSLQNLIELVELGYDVYPIVTKNVYFLDTRFGKANEFVEKLQKITGHEVVHDIVEAEKFGPKNKLDVMVVLPATGNFIAKMACGITDNPVNLAVKATLRNQSPIVLAISTNDALSANGKNIMELLNRKNVYFVPFGQDNYKEKPNSLISHYDLLVPTIEEALGSKQIQPVIKEYVKKK